MCRLNFDSRTCIGMSDQTAAAAAGRQNSRSDSLKRDASASRHLSSRSKIEPVKATLSKLQSSIQSVSSRRGEDHDVASAHSASASLVTYLSQYSALQSERQMLYPHVLL